MDKLTGVLEFDTCKIPFYKNDYVFDFTTLDISLFQQWLPSETKPTTEGFVTGKTHSGYFIAIYTGQKVFRVNAPSSLHTFLYITSKNNASDIWTGNPFDGITFCGGCIDKIYQANAIESNDLFKENEITLKLNNAKKTFNFTDDNGQKIDADYFSKQISEVYTDPDKLNECVDRFFEMYEQPVMLGLDSYAKSVGKEVDDLTVEEIHKINNHLIFLNQTGTLDEPQFHTLCEEAIETAKQLSNELTEKLDIEIEKSKEVMS